MIKIKIQHIALQFCCEIALLLHLNAKHCFEMKIGTDERTMNHSLKAECTAVKLHCCVLAFVLS